MGTVHSIRTGDIVDDGEGLPEGDPTDPWQTGIGTVFAELSTPSRPGEVMPFKREDAEVMLVQLLRCRGASFWDESACRRARAAILQRMTLSKPTNDEFVDRKADRVRSALERGTGALASQVWIEGPLDEFVRAIQASYADRQLFLKDARLAYLRAAFVACLFEANVAPAPPEEPRVPAPTVRPRDGAGPSRFRK